MLTSGDGPVGVDLNEIKQVLSSSDDTRVTRAVLKGMVDEIEHLRNLLHQYYLALRVIRRGGDSAVSLTREDMMLLAEQAVGRDISDNVDYVAALESVYLAASNLTEHSEFGETIKIVDANPEERLHLEVELVSSIARVEKFFEEDSSETDEED